MSDKFVITFRAFRFYNDGSESGSSPLADQDVNVTGFNVDSNNQFHLRISLEETGSGDIGGATTDDYGVQKRFNGAGGWETITASTSIIRTDTNSDLTDTDPTTNRATGITDGAGSFFAGIQEEGDSEITDFEHIFNDFTEHVLAFEAVSADLANADFCDFRVILNGSIVTNSVVPRITFTKTGGAAALIEPPLVHSQAVPRAANY